MKVGDCNDGLRLAGSCDVTARAGNSCMLTTGFESSGGSL